MVVSRFLLKLYGVALVTRGYMYVALTAKGIRTRVIQRRKENAGQQCSKKSRAWASLERNVVSGIRRVRDATLGRQVLRD